MGQDSVPIRTYNRISRIATQPLTTLFYAASPVILFGTYLAGTDEVIDADIVHEWNENLGKPVSYVSFFNDVPIFLRKLNSLAKEVRLGCQYQVVNDRLLYAAMMRGGSKKEMQFDENLIEMTSTMDQGNPRPAFMAYKWRGPGQVERHTCYEYPHPLALLKSEPVRKNDRTFRLERMKSSHEESPLPSNAETI